MSGIGQRPRVDRPTRRRLLSWACAVLAGIGQGPARARSAVETLGTLREVPLRDVRRLDAAEGGGWWARDAAGRIWHLAEGGHTELLGEGLDPSGGLAAGHGRLAGRGIDGRLWVRQLSRLQRAPERSEVQLAPHAGLCALPQGVIGVVEQAGGHVLARFEPGAGGLWQVVARSREPVLPDAVPVVVDLEGRGDVGHIAVLAGPDALRYSHGVLGDDIEATRVLWLERHSLEPLRTLQLDAPEVFEDRLLRPWRWPDGRRGLVTVQAGPLGARLVVVAASRSDHSALEVAAAGPAIGTRNRWLSPASVPPAGGEIWAVHTPHIGGVLYRYRSEGTAWVAERVSTGLSNHRLGARDLDVSARVGRWLLLPRQDWRGVGAVDTKTGAALAAGPAGAPIVQWMASADHRSAALLTERSLAIWTP